VAELREDGAIQEGLLTPGQLGFSSVTLDALAGGTPQDNAAVVVRVLKGEEEGGARAAVLLNAAGTLYVAGKAASLPEGLVLARDSLDSGAGYRKLEELREASNDVE